MVRSGWLVCCVVASLALAGCGGVAQVEGTVTFNGQPIEKGSIGFVSQDSAAAETVGQEVVDGKYAIGADRGLKPGKYKVEIYGSTQAAAPASRDPDMQSSAGGNQLPEKYNRNSELTAELKSGGNTVNFDLQP